MWIALASWFLSFSLLAVCAAYFIRGARIAGLAVCAILIIQVYIRPVMFFLGLDSPSPKAWFTTEEWDRIAIALMLAGLWIATITATYIAVRPIAPSRGVFPKLQTLPPLRLVLFAAIGLTLINLMATGYLVSRVGGVAQFSYAVKISKSLAGLYVIREIGSLAATLAIFGALYVMRQPGVTTRKRLVALLFGLIFVNFMINFAWGNRYNLAVLGLALLTAFHFHVRRVNLAQLIVISLVFLAFLQGLREVRTLFVSDVVGRNVDSNLDFWLKISASLHFSQFDAFLLALRDAGDKFDFRQGQDLINGLLAWVPRFLWEEKETYHIGGWFRRVYQPDKINGWPVTNPGSWYVNFGVIGIVLGGVVSGLVAATLDSHYQDVATNPWSAAVLSALSLKLVGGGVNFGIIVGYIFLAVPLFGVVAFFWLMQGRRVSQPRGPAPPLSQPAE